MKNRLAIIDADGLCYHSSKETLEESIQALNDKIQNIFDKTEATHYVMFLSKGRYFRHNLSNDYKANRAKYPTKLKWLKTLKNYLIENWNAQWMDNVEADDLCAYFYNKNIYFHQEESNFDENNMCWDKIDENAQWISEKVICSPDKDLLALEGKHFNYTYKVKEESKFKSIIIDTDIIKGWWVTTDSKTSQLNFWYSMVCGDQVDGIKGIERRGVAFANKLLSNVKFSAIQNIIHSEYQLKYGQSQGIYEFQKNYRLLHILNCDEDFIREVGKLPEFPQIQKIIKPIVNEKIEF